MGCVIGSLGANASYGLGLYTWAGLILLPRWSCVSSHWVDLVSDVLIVAGYLVVFWS